MKSLIILNIILLFTLSCSENNENVKVSVHDLLYPTLIKDYHINKYQTEVLPLYYATKNYSPEEIYQYDLKKYESSDRIRYYDRGTELVISSYKLADERSDIELKEWAIKYADYLIEIFSEPNGHFVEYEKCPWLTEETLWYTIPWGTAFRGNEMVDTYKLLKNDFSAEQLHRWQNHLEATGIWINKNPVIGAYVFNCTIDLCRLLWRIGDELGNNEWKKWAIQKAHELIKRDIDKDGWIHGEDKGVSPRYQLIGTDFVSLFAWESKDSILINTSTKLFNLHIQYSTPTMFFNGNFGTRSNELGKIDSRITTIIQAALGNKYAAYITQLYGHPEWSDNLEIWEYALQTPAKKPEYKKRITYNSINTTVIREGIFQAWFSNYDKSLWAKGFTGLWNKVSDEAVFSTLHSLPSIIEKAKLRLDDTEDFSGFPHTFIDRGTSRYHSHRSLKELTIDSSNGTNIKWQENLLSDKNTIGGQIVNEYSIKDSTINMKIKLQKTSGRAYFDFHLLRKKDQYFRLWEGKDMEAIKNGNIPFYIGEVESKFSPNENQEIIFQLNNDLYLFSFVNVPSTAMVIAGMLREEGLHTRNHGGARLRLEIPYAKDGTEIEVEFKVLGKVLK